MFRRVFPLVPAIAITLALPVRADTVLADLSKQYPWLPPLPVEITPAMAAKMTAFTKAYAVPEIRASRPANKGVDQAKVDELAARVAAIGLRRNPAGGVEAAKPILFNGENGLPKGTPAGALDFMGSLHPLLRDLRGQYGNCKNGSPECLRLEEQIRLCLEFIAAQPWDPSSGKSLWIGNGYTTLHQAPGNTMIGLSHLLGDSPVRVKLLENTWWMFNGSTTLDKTPYLSTDMMRNTMPQVFAAVAALPDGREKWQRILVLRRALDSAIIWNTNSLVCADGAVIHHGAFHDHYAQYSFGTLTEVYRKLAACGLPGEYPDEINRRLRRAGIVWAWATLGDSVAPNLRQRVNLPWANDPRIAGPSGRTDFAIGAAKVAAASGGPDPLDDRELAGLVLAVNPASAPPEWKKAWDAKGFTAIPLAGNLSLPTAGAQIHRRPGWMVVIRGQNKFFRGGEGTGGGYRYAQWGMRSTYGQRFCTGSLFIADTGTPLDPTESGWTATGFHPARVPGTTGEVLPEEKMVGSLFGTAATQGGGCDLDGQGLWALDLGGVKKSVFFIDDRITCVTSGVGPSKSHGAVATTISQAAEFAPLALELDGAVVAETTTSLPAGKAHTILDGRRRGYFIHPGGDALRLHRGVQSWIYCEMPFFNPAADPNIQAGTDSFRTVVWDKSVGAFTPNQLNSGNKAQLEGPRKLQYFTPATQRFTTIGFDHGPATTPAQAHTFTLLMACDAAKLGAFARAMDSPHPPVKFTTSAAAHTFSDAATAMTGVCLFQGGEIPAAQRFGVVTALSRPGTLLERLSGDSLALAVASTNLDLKDPIVIQAEGIWRADAAADDLAIATSAGRTTITIPYTGMNPRALRLRRGK